MSALPLPQLRRLLLGLIGPEHTAADFRTLSQADWHRLSSIAAQHRLQPHLHARLERGEIKAAIPAPIAQAWQAAHRRSALQGLAARKALLDATGLLAEAGIDSAALKGSYLAWHAYHSAAERPMRDVDLLIHPGRTLEAFNLLRSQGYQQAEPSARLPEHALQHDKHLPPLVSPDGVRFELHMRLWERSEAIGWWMPAGEHEAIFVRAGPASADDPIRYPQAEDMLTHLIIHAALSNRFNGGPLGLIDIACLLQRASIDWPRFWRRAQDGGWDRAAGLVLDLVARWCRPALREEVQCPLSVDPSVIDLTPDLLLQDLSQTKAVGFLASLGGAARRGGAIGAFSHLAGRAKGKDRARYTGQEAVAGGFGRWFVSRFTETAASLLRPDNRLVAGRSVKLGSWLAGEDAR